jgi:hypothetical protein
MRFLLFAVVTVVSTPGYCQVPKIASYILIPLEGFVGTHPRWEPYA